MEKKKFGMDAFNVAKKSNEGVKLPLALPDGTETDEYLIIRGADSTRFRGVKAKSNREMLKALKGCKDKPEKQEKIEADFTRKMVASLVAGWSFPEECNEENVCKFLESAPQVQEQIDLFAGQRTNFFEKPPRD